jgi:hypothetical protein
MSRSKFTLAELTSAPDNRDVTHEQPPEDQGLPAPGQYREDWTGDVTGLVLLLRGRRGAVALVVCLAAVAALLLWMFL